MTEKEEIEELEDENVEVEIETRFNLNWTCPNCKEENIELDIPADGTVKCVCYKCSSTYEYYHCIY